MRKVKLILAAATLSVSGNALAQDMNEAYNLSNTTVQGTARSVGFGGALGSIGGDFSCLSVNPAGLGVYRTSELSFSPSLKMNYTSSGFQGQTTDDNNTKLNINNFSVVLTEAPKGRRYDHRKWKAVSFAFGMNRVADFNREYNYKGYNNSGSASLLFESDANQYPNDLSDASTLGYMGINTHLIAPHFTSYYSTVPFAGGIQQSNIVKETGGISEYVVALGGNYKERLMLGATIGIPSMHYKRTSDYTESLIPGNTYYNPDAFSTFTYNNQLNINATGVNMKLGAILKLTNFFRIGAAFHTPTLYNIHEFTDYGLTSLVNNVQYNVSTANALPVYQFDYSLLTPYKGVLSAAIVIKKLGFITADYEYIDYSTMKYYYPDGVNTATGISYQQEATDMNNNIKNTYKAVSNVRLGAEIKLARYLMVRAGAGYYGNPYKSGMSMERIDLSAGIGFHGTHFFADVAVVNSNWKYEEQVYSNVDYRYVATPNTGALAPVATIKPTTNNAVMTVGVKF